MICKCKYFCMVDGKLVCSQCGKPAKTENVIEDKIYDPESRRLKNVIKDKHGTNNRTGKPRRG
jgi:uncharacterized Zn finger protein (UPF0148 family)